MHILIIGAAGMVGAQADRAAGQGRRPRRQGHRPADAGRRRRSRRRRPARRSPVDDAGDRTSPTPGEAAKLVAARPDVIFHLAAIVSGEAEADFDKGYRINLDGTRCLFEAIRKVGDGYKPRVVFTSSIAVFGAPFPDAIGDEFFDDAAHLLRHAEGDRRAAALRLHARAASSTASASACRPSACARASPTRRPRASSPTSSASRWPARRRCCRSPRTCATGTPARARRSAS